MDHPAAGEYRTHLHSVLDALMIKALQRGMFGEITLTASVKDGLPVDIKTRVERREPLKRETANT